MVGDNIRCKNPGRGVKSYAEVLGIHDDVGSHIIIDMMLGFTTHKMGFTKLPPKPDLATIKNIVSSFRKYGDEHFILNELIHVLGSWWEDYCDRNPMANIVELKEHVRRSYFIFLFVFNVFTFVLHSSALLSDIKIQLR